MRLQDLYDALRAEFETDREPDVESVWALLRSGVDPNNELARNQFCQQVPIHYAAQHNHLQAAEVLLNEGAADPNLATDARNTALHLVAEQGHEHMTTLANAAGPILQAAAGANAFLTKLRGRSGGVPSRTAKTCTARTISPLPADTRLTERRRCTPRAQFRLCPRKSGQARQG